MLHKLFLALRAIVVTMVFSLAGCTVSNFINNELHGGFLTQWKFITSTPQPDLVLAGVSPCYAVVGNQQAKILFHNATEETWGLYDECTETWETSSTSPDVTFASSSPCKIGESASWAYAESRLPGEGASCWQIVWSWEISYIASRYIYLTDGHLLSWTVDQSVGSLIRGIVIGWVVGLWLAWFFLSRYKQLPTSKPDQPSS